MNDNTEHTLADTNSVSVSQRYSRKALGSTIALMLMGFGAAPNALALDDFRILPYLQQPGSNGMLFTWFTETDQSGSLTINGAGLASPLIFSSLPSHQANLRYTQAELAQTIPGLTPGSWLFSNENYKHSVDVRGLQADSTYTYTVTQGSSVFTREFKTAPTAQDWSHVRFIAMSDSETEPRGRVTYREWQPGEIASGNRPSLSSSQWATLFGTSGSGANQMLRYALTETEGYKHNLAIVDSRNPDFIVMPGDLVQGGGYQPGWDEFFKHNAGAFDDVLTKRAIIPALGNWENFGALNGGYGAFNDPTFGNDVFAPLFGREKYKTYFDMPENGTPNHRGNYYRVDYGPVTIITLDSSNGEPEDRPQNYGGTGQTPKLVGQEYTGPGTDTQNNFTRAQYESFGGNDLSDFNPGSTQWEWTRSQLQEAREQGQVVFVQFHHAPYSDGEHGLPMNHAQTTGQGGTPMRPYHSMFERFGVAAVLSGHSEMFERSFVDNDGDGIGVHYYDVGAAGDGLRGERRNSPGFGNNRLQYNSFSQWSSDEHEPEVWNIVNGIEQLIAGGKHYGHLEVNLYKRDDGYDLLELIPVYSFPFLDDQYQLLGAERRIYGDTIQLFITENGSVKPVPLPSAIWFLGSGLIWLLGFARKR